jgi:hypothetical protein
MNLHDEFLGATFTPAFFAAMLQEGGRQEADNHQHVSLWDWIFTYIAF